MQILGIRLQNLIEQIWNETPEIEFFNKHPRWNSSYSLSILMRFL